MLKLEVLLTHTDAESQDPQALAHGTSTLPQMITSGSLLVAMAAVTTVSVEVKSAVSVGTLAMLISSKRLAETSLVTGLLIKFVE